MAFPPRRERRAPLQGSVAQRAADAECTRTPRRAGWHPAWLGWSRIAPARPSAPRKPPLCLARYRNRRPARRRRRARRALPRACWRCRRCQQSQNVSDSACARGRLPSTGMSLPSQSLSAVWYGIGDLRLEHRPLPAMGPTDVVVDVVACGVCATDLHLLDGSIALYPPPKVLGHEIAGTVRAVGD